MAHLGKLAAGFVALFGLVACGGSVGPDALKSEPQVEEKRETVWDLFSNNDNPNTTVRVNKYIWGATLEVLDFMPVKSADPFTGIIVFDYGRPAGGKQAYRGTVLVRDPALDARSLSVSLATRSGAVSAATVKKIEDAILTRARELRIRDGKL